MQISDLDARDKAILNALQDDGRVTNSDLADKVGLSPSACLRRTRLLEESKLVERYALLLDHKECGFSGTAFVFITLEKQTRDALDKFEAAVMRIPEIMECYLLAGQRDYLMRIIFTDTTELERLHTEVLTHLPGVERVQSTLTLRKVKRTTKLPLRAV